MSGIPEDEVPIGAPDATDIAEPQPLPYDGPDRRKASPTNKNGTAHHAAVGAAVGAATGEAIASGMLGIRGNLWQNLMQSTFAVVFIAISIMYFTYSRSDEHERVIREDRREADRITRETQRESERTRRDDQREQYMREDVRDTRKGIADNTAALRELVTEFRAMRKQDELRR